MDVGSCEMDVEYTCSDFFWNAPVAALFKLDDEEEADEVEMGSEMKEDESMVVQLEAFLNAAVSAPYCSVTAAVAAML